MKSQICQSRIGEASERARQERHAEVHQEGLGQRRVGEVLAGRQDAADRPRQELEDLRRPGPGREERHEDRDDRDDEALAELLEVLEEAHPGQLVLGRGRRPPDLSLEKLARVEAAQAGRIGGSVRGTASGGLVRNRRRGLKRQRVLQRRDL